VLGASVKDILVMINKKYAGYIAIAFIIAIPLSLYGVEKWLQNFAYRISISSMDYVVTGIVILLMATLTISFQSFSAAATNPADTLKEE
jgi:putative ABC transport system permease protein